MSEEQDLYGTTRSIPGDGDLDWGSEVRATLISLCKGLNSLSTLVNDQAFLVLEPTNTVFAEADNTLTVLTPRHNIKNNHSTTDIISLTSIAAGAKDGQTVLLVGDRENTSDKFVTMQAGSVTNASLNGNMQLKPGAAIYLVWDESDSGNKVWRELSRSI